MDVRLLNKYNKRSKSHEIKNIRNIMTKKYWFADEFTIEFNKVKKLILPSIFKYQVARVARIVDHWQECYSCKLGFNISEYSGTFEELFTHLADCQIENHICDGDYDVLDSRSRPKLKNVEKIYMEC